MNTFVIVYLLLTPVFGLLMLLKFYADRLKRWWWLYRHPETVYKVRIHFSNKMFISRYVSTRLEEFELKDKIYIIKKTAIIRLNWSGVIPNNAVPLTKDNTIDFKDYKIWNGSEFEDRPRKGELVGELEYIDGLPNPLEFVFNEAVSSDVIGNKSVSSDGDKDSKSSGTKAFAVNSSDLRKIQKNSVLSQLLTALENQNFFIIIIILLFIILGLCGFLLGLRLDWVNIPLEVVCVAG